MVHVALLRAVNVAGTQRVAMADLRTLCASLGFEGRTLLQSGNIVVRGASGSAAALEATFENAAEKTLGLKTDFFVRSAAEWTAIIKANPFGREASAAPGHLVVLLLKKAAKAADVAALQAAIKGREAVHAGARHIYAIYPDGIGRSKLTTKMIESRLGTRVTGRNWNTVMKLAELAKE